LIGKNIYNKYIIDWDIHNTISKILFISIIPGRLSLYEEYSANKETGMFTVKTGKIKYKCKRGKQDAHT
jgi:hypothetical protein